ncbi:hypothetical protein [Rhodocyclus tenuis]|uniref:hypothetical protein n=1 Tax=Rhodocyclus tenuis TaxID=1066 RepID=UPI001906BD23|nr:hypothetical protein [Rhodocyclus tenuis]MBK1678820.1 hypothetical protein [Rhodocyclus tenuis]
MRNRIFNRILAPLCLCGGFALVQAAEPPTTPAAPPAPATTATQPPIFGSQLMTPQERRDYRLRMRNAKTPDERESIRLEHHEAMKARAAERGLSLPDAPPPRGAGMGPAGGMGQGGMGGMGPGGGGMGPGPGNYAR